MCETSEQKDSEDLYSQLHLLRVEFSVNKAPLSALSRKCFSMTAGKLNWRGDSA
jgi:hypothetical protein